MTEMFGEAWSPMSVPDLAPDDDDDDLFRHTFLLFLDCMWETLKWWVYVPPNDVIIRIPNLDVLSLIPDKEPMSKIAKIIIILPEEWTALIFLILIFRCETNTMKTSIR